MSTQGSVYPRLALGIVAVSFGAILIRLAGEAPPLAIAAWRLTLAAVVLVPIALRRRERTIDRRTFAWSVVSGAALAAHFVLWIASFETTTVSSSVLFMSTHPIFVGIGSILFLRERPSRALAAAIVLAAVGGALIGFGDVRFGGPAIRGDLLALGGGVMAAAYFLIGRRVRRTVSVSEYAATSYGTAAVLVLLVCCAMRIRLVGFTSHTIVALVLLALVPQLIGHSTINWALERLSAARVSVFVLAEPVIATLLAIAFFREVPGGLNLLGAATILAGIYLSLRSQEAPHGTEP